MKCLEDRKASMGVWEYGTCTLILIKLIKNIKMRAASTGYGIVFFIPILPYSHTPILVL